MKMKIFLIAISIILFASISFAATLNLKATWTANTETDMASYKLYRTDGIRTLIGTIPHPTTVYNFSTAAPDNEDYTLTFALTAVDTAGNESVDTAAPFFSNKKSPAATKGFLIQEQ